ncbi:MAG: hypothetical protein CL534_22985 [Ahrensia sp.]|nr:hypothetical protein [Ahrensia sp.]
MSGKTDKTGDRLGADADVFYEALAEAHEGLTLEQCLRMDTRLILILANRVGDIDFLAAALAAARKGAK